MDFFKQESQIMLIFTTQISCILICSIQNTGIFGQWNAIFKQNFSDRIRYYCIPMNCTILITWLVFIWLGTSYDTLFKTRNKIIMGFLLLTDIAIIVYVLIEWVKNIKINKKLGLRSDVYFIFGMLKLCDLYCFYIYFFYGVFKRYTDRSNTLQSQSIVGNKMEIDIDKNLKTIDDGNR